MAPQPPKGSSRRCLGAALAAALALGNPLLHGTAAGLSDLLARRYGFDRYSLAALITISASTLLGLLALAIGRRQLTVSAPRLGAAAVLIACTVLAQRSLLYSSVEVIHYLQYAALTAALALAGVTTERAWLLATAAGIGDETYQRLVTFAGAANRQLDFNDMVLNAVGAGWAALALGPSRAAPRRGPLLGRSRWSWAAAAAALCGCGAWAVVELAGREVLLLGAPLGRHYHQLSLPGGGSLVIVLWIAVALATSRAAAASRPAAPR